MRPNITYLQYGDLGVGCFSIATNENVNDQSYFDRITKGAVQVKHDHRGAHALLAEILPRTAAALFLLL